MSTYSQNRHRLDVNLVICIIDPTDRSLEMLIRPLCPSCDWSDLERLSSGWIYGGPVMVLLSR